MDWLSKVENDHIQLDRLSVIARLAQALDVTVGDLVGEPSMSSPNAESDIVTVPALRDVLLDYRHIAPRRAPSRLTVLPRWTASDASWRP